MIVTPVFAGVPVTASTILTSVAGPNSDGFVEIHDIHDAHSVQWTYTGGILRLYYKLSSRRTGMTPQPPAGQLIISGAAADGHRPLVLLPNRYIIFYAEEIGGNEAISTLTVDFIQAERMTGGYHGVV